MRITIGNVCIFRGSGWQSGQESGGGVGGGSAGGSSGSEAALAADWKRGAGAPRPGESRLMRLMNRQPLKGE